MNDGRRRQGVTGRIAVVLFNLGGPDRPEAVRPFLRNLFGDKAIIGVPQPFRRLLAEVISRRRAPVARARSSIASTSCSPSGRVWRTSSSEPG